MIVAPLLLLVLTVYLHLFYGYWLQLEQARLAYNQQPERTESPIESKPTLFSLPGPIPRILTTFVFYWFVPIILGIIVWKGCVRHEFRYPLFYSACLVTFSLLFLQINRSPELHKLRLSIKHWVVWLYIIMIAFLIFTLELLHRPLYLERGDFRGAMFELLDLRYAHMSNTNLDGAFLVKTDFCEAKLESSSLAGAKLMGAKLMGANLMGANLVGANLMRANLIGSNLMRVNFEGADLQGASFCQANLIGADLKGADLEGADLQETNFKGVKNLESEQIKKAINWTQAFYSEEDLVKLNLPSDHNKIVQESIHKQMKETQMKETQMKETTPINIPF